MTKLTVLIISAGLCFSLVADAKAVKIPQWIFGFTFGAPVAVHRAQCKALKGMWDYENSNEYHYSCHRPQAGPDLECARSCNYVRVDYGSSGPSHRYETYQVSFLHHMWGTEDLSCYNNWLEWAHSVFGEPLKLDNEYFIWRSEQCNKNRSICTSSAVTIDRANFRNGFEVRLSRGISKVIPDPQSD